MEKVGAAMRFLMAGIQKNWFLLGLVIVFAMTLSDDSEIISSAGVWLKSYHGANMAIFVIFFFSGLLLDVTQIKAGVNHVKSILLSLMLIFLAAPAVSLIFGMTSVDTGIKIGMFLVAVMPTTLSSGVVMTGAAGGNMACALVTTIIANSLAVVTIPVTLFYLMGTLGFRLATSIDNSAVMVKIGLLVLVPLCLGLTVKASDRIAPVVGRYAAYLQNFNQFMILCIVWMAISQAKPTIMQNSGEMFTVMTSVAGFHGVLLMVGICVITVFRIKPGQRESTLLMGCQKTLPLSILLQMSLFPEYGIVLTVCVLHHLVQLVMDSVAVNRLKRAHVCFSA